MPNKDWTSDSSSFFQLRRTVFAKTATTVKNGKKWYGNSSNRDSSVVFENRQNFQQPIKPFNTKKMDLCFCQPFRPNS